MKSFYLSMSYDQIVLTSYKQVSKKCKNTGKIEHGLVNILCVCTVICGAEAWSDIEEFGKARLAWRQQKGLLKNGVPVDDTIAHGVSVLNSKQLQACFIDGRQEVSIKTAGAIIAIEGKTVRRSFDKRLNKAAIPGVSAFACAKGGVLGQEKTQEKSNEITAIPALLALLDIQRSIITIDALGGQKKRAQQLIEQGADYVLAVKENQQQPYEEITDFFQGGEAHGFKQLDSDYYEGIDKGPGRIEIRRYGITEALICIRNQENGNGLRCIGMAANETRNDGKISKERGYFIAGFAPDGKRFEQAVRHHWGIENRRRRVLDMSFIDLIPSLHMYYTVLRQLGRLAQSYKPLPT
ncbi:MAG: ISAs1 family transposase [Proteobacteria bacterium]|nr:ISAs1 family transposase [Pseudomonadota bacterium]